MSISRWIVVVPVLVGFAVTGSAVAHMLPRETVRDTVYQTCQHNGVHFNKQGHANCGLHKGWSDDPTTEAGDEPGSEEPGDQPTTAAGGGGHAPKHGGKADHDNGNGNGHGHHGATTRGESSGHGHGGGKAASHGGGHGHATTHGGGHGHGGGQGHSHNKG
ncbi:MAG TPA: hypothetical protein VM684_11155 [Gaiellales bacterium]|jgi:hypothetical protein|nr:hypothetical protein [Gaiellales bacterium]